MSIHQLLDCLLYYQRKYPSTAYVYAVTGNMSMALMQVCAKYLNRQITIAHMLYLRSIFLIIVNSLVLWLTGHAFHVSSPRAFRLILIRMILAATVVYLFFSPVNCISISIINSLWMTVPVWTPLAERLIVGSAINKSAFVAILISFAGILLIIQPEFLFGTSGDVSLQCCLMVLVAALLNSFSMVTLRMLKAFITNDTALQYFYLGQIFSNSLIMSGEDNSHLQQQSLSWSFVGIMMLLVVFAYLAQVSIGRAVFLVPASRIMPFNYVLVVFSFFIDVVVFHQRFSWLAILGILVVCLSLLYIMRNSADTKQIRSPQYSEDSTSLH